MPRFLPALSLLLLAPCLADDKKPEAPKEAPENALQKKLEAKVHFNFQGIRFQDAKEYLEKQGGIPIDIDPSALEKVPGLNDEMITLETPDTGYALSDALTSLVNPLGLTWMVRDGKILILAEDKK